MTTEPAAEEQDSRVARFVRRRSELGLVLGWLALLVSFAPSLLPRPWYVQAAASALSVVTGYAAGALLGLIVKDVARWLGVRIFVVDRAHRTRLNITLGVLAGVITLGLWLAGYQGRRHSAQLVGLPSPSLGTDALSLLAAVGVTAVLMALIWAVRSAFRMSRRVLRFALPKPIAGLLAVALVALAGTWLSTSVIAARGLESLSASASKVNKQSPEGVSAPNSALVSGGPGATQPWTDLGREGQIYTGHTPTAAQVQALSGRPAEQPIRLYAAPPDGHLRADELADTIVREIQRTGALNRKYLNLVGTTGSGWVDEYNVRSLEVLTDGDVATAAVQYSFLPSVAQFLTNRTLPAQVGRTLVRRVTALVQAQPADRRPKLLLSGESLGALSTEAAYDNAGELMKSPVAGALWTGTPNSTPLWRSITASRQKGSPQIAPVIDNGRNIRFAGNPSQINADAYGRPLGQWGDRRFLFMQHPSDPIVWWDWSLIYDRPSWSKEPSGFDVDSDLGWYPLVTFWLTSVDLISANAAPGGHGHRYRAEQVDGWAGVLDVSPGPGEKDRIVASIEALDKDS